MHCIILVLDNPYFASTDGEGHYEIPDLPAGIYRITAWHERLPPRTIEVTVPAAGAAQADFVLGIVGLPQY